MFIVKNLGHTEKLKEENEKYPETCYLAITTTNILLVFLSLFFKVNIFNILLSTINSGTLTGLKWKMIQQRA